MNTFVRRLEARARQVDSLLCVGLDPHPQDLPNPSPQAAREYCLRLIQSTASSAAAFKPNMAFFEVYGAEGLKALAEVIAAVPEGIPVILDGKRADIPSTAQAYAQAAFRTLGADAITANPYLGSDALQPFLEDPEKGVFLLCKTSNPGSADLQDLPVFSGGGWQKQYEVVASLAQRWNQYDNLGLVVGATYPEVLRQVRALAPDMWILAPGVGAQGGDLQAALEAGLRSDGLGLLLSVSRSLARSPHPDLAAEELRQAINRGRERRRAALNQRVALPLQDVHLSTLADGLLAAGCVRFGQFKLKSGLDSPIYIDLRRLVGNPSLLTEVAAAYLPILRRLSFDQLAALPYAAIPIATAISLLTGWPMLYPRKEAKDYGTRAEVEGVFSPGQRVVVIDDLATTGESKLEALEKLQHAGLHVSDVVVLIDRQSGAPRALSQIGVRFHAVFKLAELLDYWEANGRISPDQAAAARAMIASSAEG